jgi:hypothetical protein
MTKRRTDNINTIAKRRRTDNINTMAKRRRTDNINTMACAKVERTNDFRLNR